MLLNMRIILYLLITATATTTSISAWMLQPTIVTTRQNSNHRMVAQLHVQVSKAFSFDGGLDIDNTESKSQSKNENVSTSSSPKESTTTCRRNFGKSFLLLATTATTLMTSATFRALPANAIPMISTDEFTIILRDSARSIVRVEFAGAQNDQVEVLLADGTRFGLNDVVESSVDPRSPLKIAALCRENGVSTKFVNLEAALAKAPKRTKSYANARVQEAAQKEKEKLARMQQDEQDRLAALAEMQAKEEAAAASQ